MTVSRALTDDGPQRETEGDLYMKTKCSGNPITDAIFAEINAERRAYIEEVGFDRWFQELLERNSVSEPDLEVSLDRIFAKIEEEELQKTGQHRAMIWQHDRKGTKGGSADDCFKSLD